MVFLEGMEGLVLAMVGSMDCHLENIHFLGEKGLGFPKGLTLDCMGVDSMEEKVMAMVWKSSIRKACYD
ncbi:hypothetical protein EB796_008448 [Bugula neritina]|uniref:Uncharacterized protein n=1 Tax=Bugula neritina TaxID=10212 RepID=A0A7J7K6R2_BUGNE|nr:hypothetical protein EB796_008448 [Bugula neritina]